MDMFWRCIESETRRPRMVHRSSFCSMALLILLTPGSSIIQMSRLPSFWPGPAMTYGLATKEDPVTAASTRSLTQIRAIGRRGRNSSALAGRNLAITMLPLKSIMFCIKLAESNWPGSGTPPATPKCSTAWALKSRTISHQKSTFLSLWHLWPELIMWSHGFWNSCRITCLKSRQWRKRLAGMRLERAGRMRVSRRCVGWPHPCVLGPSPSFWRTTQSWMIQTDSRYTWVMFQAGQVWEPSSIKLRM